MNNKTFYISKPAFDELCKYVCFQLQPSSYEQLDRETINFAIYWQTCLIFEKKVEIFTGFRSKIPFYQAQLQDIIDGQRNDSFDVSEIIEKNVSEFFQYSYSNLKNSFEQQKANTEVWSETSANL